jgi:ankyrin repeat protein
MKLNFFFSRLIHSPIIYLAALSLIMLSWSCPAFCGPIHDAAKDGDLEKAQKLLKDNPALISSKDDFGWTPLHLAATYGHKPAAQLLLDNKADINAKDINGDTPLHLAAFYGYKDVVELLLDNKAASNSKNSKGKTPLYSAAHNGHKDIADLLRKRGGHE